MALKYTLVALGFAAIAGSATAQSEWDRNYNERREISLNAEAVPQLTEEISRVPTLVRLHGGVFDFTDANDDGSDLRFVAADGTTPLNYHIERYDPIAELGLIWVDVPSVEPAVSQSFWLYSGNISAAPISSPIAIYDGEFAYVLNMSEDAQVPADQTANATRFTANGVKPVLDGVVAGAMELGPDSYIRAAADRLTNIEAGAGQMTWSAWIRPVGTEQGASGGLIYSKLSAEGVPGLHLGLRDGLLFAQSGDVRVEASEPLVGGDWSFVAVSADGEAIRLFQNGSEVARVEAQLPELNGDEVIGSSDDRPGFIGTIDEVQRSNTARSESYLAFAARTQGRNADVLAVSGEAEETGANQHDYMSILFNALTIDAWVVIIVLAIMSAISWLIMISKGFLFHTTNGKNKNFIRFYKTQTRGQGAHTGLVDRDLAEACPKSTLARLFSVGQYELLERLDEAKEEHSKFALAPQSVAAIRSALDAAQVREEQRLSQWMVLLTIAISGGPFLGLLGTVLGVMITFAGVAAAGEVNVTAIAPGIAAALLATVAGLAVAIPALFGYNYLTTQLDKISTDNQVFVDELEKRIAETYRGEHFSGRLTAQDNGAAR